MKSQNYFEGPFKGKRLVEQITNPNIIVGRYSYYSEYYHRHSFDDCARYLMPDRIDVDKLIIGSFIVAGKPAKPIRKRFTEDEIKLLLEMAWWDWPEEQLASAMKILCSKDIEGLYKVFKREF